ncbi:Uncharacterised protein [uncultured archaeon]|nr:Uncharacterised protein [uncultured archaeon]
MPKKPSDPPFAEWTTEDLLRMVDMERRRLPRLAADKELSKSQPMHMSVINLLDAVRILTRRKIPIRMDISRFPPHVQAKILEEAKKRSMINAGLPLPPKAKRVKMKIRRTKPRQ